MRQCLRGCGQALSQRRSICHSHWEWVILQNRLRNVRCLAFPPIVSCWTFLGTLPRLLNTLDNIAKTFSAHSADLLPTHRKTKGKRQAFEQIHNVGAWSGGLLTYRIFFAFARFDVVDLCLERLSFALGAAFVRALADLCSDDRVQLLGRHRTVLETAHIVSRRHTATYVERDDFAFIELACQTEQQPVA